MLQYESVVHIMILIKSNFYCLDTAVAFVLVNTPKIQKYGWHVSYYSRVE